MVRLALILVGCMLLGSVARAEQAPIRVASKNFNESYVLGEMVAQLLESEGFSVERRFGLGGTLICYQALLNDEIDLYVEYSGTLSQAILKLPVNTEFADLNSHVDALVWKCSHRWASITLMRWWSPRNWPWREACLTLPISAVIRTCGWCLATSF